MMTMATPAPMPHAGPPSAPQLVVDHHHHHRRMRPEDAALHITVSDPVQHADGLNKYTSYRVDVRPPSSLLVPGSNNNDPNTTNMMMNMMSQMPNMNNNNNNAYSAVLRRYSDFLWLHDRLHLERAGAIVPPIPDKQPVGRFNSAFVEERRVHLERFLRRVATHPELADAAGLDLFLRADDVTFQAAKNAKGVAIPSASTTSSNNMMNPAVVSQASMMMMHPPGATVPVKKEGIKRWFAEAKTSMTGDLVRSPDDDLFEEINRYISGLDSQMKNVSNQASGLVRKGKEIANGLFEFGLAFNLLGQSEADALGSALSKMGETADRLSVLSAEHAEKEMREFEEPLQDYIKLIHSVKLALQRRHEKRLTYSTCLAEVESKQSQLGKLRMQIGSEAKAYQMEMALRRAQEAAEVAREDFAVVSQRVLREVDRFKREKAEDMRRVVLDYINLQVEYNKRMEEIWATLIPKLEAAQMDSHQLQQHMHPNVLPPGPNPVSPDRSPQRPSTGMYTNAPATATMMNAGGGGTATTTQPMMHQQAPMPSQPPPPVPPMMYGNSNTSVPTPDPSAMISVQYRDTSSLMSSNMT